MKIALFNYNLPKSLIAQQPMKPRDHSRLLVLDKKSKKIQHKNFYDLPALLKPGDVLVLNDTKVFPARLIGHKKSGGQVEVFLLKSLKGSVWEALLKGRHLQKGDTILFTKNLQAKILSDSKTKVKKVSFNIPPSALYKKIVQLGQTPLPPYIKTKDSAQIRRDYQTVFAKHRGSVAAPTAGLHFTKDLLSKLKKKGVKIYKITLHVGWGTFAPVVVNDVRQHVIHEELVSIDQATARAINSLKKSGRRIIAVGTTTTRALEAMTKNGLLQSGQSMAKIYIYPGYRFKLVDALITNFHLPQSSLLFLVSALAGRKNTLQAYQTAVRKKYRFYSFGDAMFIR